MIGKRLSHFRILAKLGEGGMGVVYRAEDEKLGREVAVKVLRPEAVVDEERRLRFLREARTAARVSHPHIASIYEVDEAGGVIFIAMELVEGQTLDSLIGEGPLSRRDALRYAIEIAEALTQAHEVKVVHRDLKPDNIIVGPGRHVKILDFGLAKLREPPEIAASDEATRMQTISAEMTREGRVLGTAAYMSPEQARGLELDSRSDLFSFGIVLYEMVTGKNPFRGATVTDTFSAILRDAPVPPTRHNPKVPPELERIIAKCLHKDPKDRYQHADEIVVDLRNLKRETDSQPLPSAATAGVDPARAKPTWLRPLPIGIGLVILSALLFGVPRFLGPGGAIPDARADINSLAVLPLQNLKDGDDPERLGRILQELIITDLSGLEPLKVFSSQRLYDIRKQLGDGDVTTIEAALATEVARRAGARTMLTGSLSQLGQRWILTCQLVDVDDGAVIRSERIDGSDLYAMVDSLTARIRSDLDLDLAVARSIEQAVGDKTTDSIEAWQHYLAGIEHLNDQDHEKAVADFEKAIEIDPAFGQAHYKLAVATWWFKPDQMWFAGAEVVRPEEILERLLSGEVKVSRKERLLAEALQPMVKHQEDALPRFERLAREYPDEKEVWYGLGEALYHQAGGVGKLDALDAFEKALELDPTFRLAYAHILGIFLDEKMYDRGIAQVRRLIEQNPKETSWYGDLLTLVIHKGDASEIDVTLDQALGRVTGEEERSRLLRAAAEAHGHVGNEEKEEELLRRALEVGVENDRDSVLAALGSHFLDLHRYEEAEEYYLRAMELNPERHTEDVGWLYVEQRKYTEALEHLERLIGEDPEHLPYRTFRAAGEIERGNEAAGAAIEDALRHASSDYDRAMVYLISGTHYSRIADYNGTADVLNKARSADPDHPWLPGALGWLLLQRRDYDAAASTFQAELERDPADMPALSGLLAAQQRSGGHEKALDLLREGVPDPDLFYWKTERLEALILAGRTEDAEALLESTLPGLPSDSQRRGLLWRAQLGYLRTGRFDQAEAAARRALALAPDGRDLNVLRTLGWGLARQGRLAEAERAVQEALEINPRSYESLFLLAAVKLLRKEFEPAEEIARELLANGPAHRDAHAFLAYSLAERGRLREAEPFARKALEMDSLRESHTLLAWVLIAGELDVERGVELASRALELPPNPWAISETFPVMPSPEHCLGLAHLKKGEYEQAVGLLEKAAKLRPDRPSIRKHVEQARAKLRTAAG